MKGFVPGPGPCSALALTFDLGQIGKVFNENRGPLWDVAWPWLSIQIIWKCRIAGSEVLQQQTTFKANIKGSKVTACVTRSLCSFRVQSQMFPVHGNQSRRILASVFSRYCGVSRLALMVQRQELGEWWMSLLAGDQAPNYSRFALSAQA